MRKLRDDDRDTAVLQGVSIDEALLDVGRLNKDILNLLWGDVLSLRKLEDVLASVKDLDGSVGVDNADIASVQVALSIDCLGGLVWSHKVTGCDARTANTDLTARERFVSNTVVHIRQVLQADGAMLKRSSNGA